MGDFYSIYSHGLLRASASPVRISLADPAGNAAEVVQALDAADQAGAGLVVFPELCLSGYAIDDLLQQSVVLDGVLDAVERPRRSCALARNGDHQDSLSRYQRIVPSSPCSKLWAGRQDSSRSILLASIA